MTENSKPRLGPFSPPWSSLTRGLVQAVKPGWAQRVQEGADQKVAKSDKHCKACYALVQDKNGEATSDGRNKPLLARSHRAE